MTTKSRNNQRPIPAKARGTYCKTYVCVPVPPEVARWQYGGAGQEPYRQITQDRARDITGKSAHTIRRWAHGHQPIDVTSLRLLQIWVWGIIPSQAFIDQGVFIKYSDRYTLGRDKQPMDVIIGPHENRAITVHQVLGFHWLHTFYQREVTAYHLANKEKSLALIPTAKIIPITEYLRRRDLPAPDAGKDLA